MRKISGNPSSISEPFETIKHATRILRRVFFTVLSAAIIVVSAVVFIGQLLGTGKQGEYFYFGTAALILLGWCLSRIGFSRTRLRHNDSPRIPMMFQPDQSDGLKRWKFSMGNSADEFDSMGGVGKNAFKLTKSFSIPLAGLPIDQLPDDQTVTVIRGKIVQGQTVENACREIHPPFDSWDTMQQGACVLYVMEKLERLQQQDGF